MLNRTFWASFASLAAVSQSFGSALPVAAKADFSRSQSPTGDRFSAFFLNPKTRLHPIHPSHQPNAVPFDSLFNGVPLQVSRSSSLRLDQDTIHLDPDFFNLNTVTPPQPFAQVALGNETANFGTVPAPASLLYGGGAIVLMAGALAVYKRRRVSRAIAQMPAVLRADLHDIAATVLHGSIVLAAKTGFLAFLILCWIPFKKAPQSAPTRRSQCRDEKL